MIRAYCEKGKYSIANMARGYCGISFIVYILLYFISFGIERTNNSRCGFRIVRKTKVKKLKVVDDDEFYDVTSCHAEVNDKVDDGRKLGKRRKNGDVKKRERKAFRINRVAPAPEVEAWRKTSGKTPRAENKYICVESCYTATTVFVEEDGKMVLKRSAQKWDTKTGKEIKLDNNETNESSSSVDTDPSSFLSVLTPRTTDNFNLCDLFYHEDDDVPGPSSDCVMNEMVLDLTDAKEWEDTGKRAKKKSTLSNFLSRFQRSGPKTTKVHKIRIWKTIFSKAPFQNPLSKTAFQTPFTKPPF